MIRALQKWHLVYCMRVMSIGCTMIEVPLTECKIFAMHIVDLGLNKFHETSVINKAGGKF
jgi:hypothetical protein